MVPKLANLEKIITTAMEHKKSHLAKQPHQWDAAVLLPLVEVQGEPAFLFEKRASSLSWQPGDICFPGGRYECKDKDYAVTAKREACEELGLAASAVKICGSLNYLVTHMGPVVHPYVGILQDIEHIKFNKDEVESVFTVPVAFFKDYVPKEVTMEQGTRAPEDFPFDLVPTVSRQWRKRTGYKVYFYVYEGHVIWGMTGLILHSFLEKYGKDIFK